MATTNFTTGTVISSDWCNDVDAAVYEGTFNTPITVQADTTEVGLTVNSTSDSTVLRGNKFNSDPYITSSLTLAKSRGTTLGDYTLIQTGDVLGRILFYGSNGTTFVNAAQINCVVDDIGTPSATSMPSKLQFYTIPDGSTTLTPRQIIDANGNVAIGGADPVAGRSFTVNKLITGAVGGYGIMSAGQVQSDVTSAYYAFSSFPTTQATAFTLTSLVHYNAVQSTIGAGSTVTNQYGFLANSTLSGAGSNYGFYGDIAADSLNDWNFYANGTAPNYFKGATYNGAKFGYGRLSGVGGEVTQLTDKSTGVTLNKVCGAIIMHAESIGNGVLRSFTLTNSEIAITDVVVANIKLNATAGAYTLIVDQMAAGSCRFSLRNVSGGALGEAVVINFAVIRAVNN